MSLLQTLSYEPRFVISIFKIYIIGQVLKPENFQLYEGCIDTEWTSSLRRSADKSRDLTPVSIFSESCILACDVIGVAV